MPIAETNPKVRLIIEEISQRFDNAADRVGAGGIEVSTPLFCAVCELDRAVGRLRRVVELQLSLRLSEENAASVPPAWMRS